MLGYRSWIGAALKVSKVYFCRVCHSAILAGWRVETIHQQFLFFSQGHKSKVPHQQLHKEMRVEALQGLTEEPLFWNLTSLPRVGLCFGNLGKVPVVECSCSIDPGQECAREFFPHQSVATCPLNPHPRRCKLKSYHATIHSIMLAAGDLLIQQEYMTCQLLESHGWTQTSKYWPHMQMQINSNTPESKCCAALMAMKFYFICLKKNLVQQWD